MHLSIAPATLAKTFKPHRQCLAVTVLLGISEDGSKSDHLVPNDLLKPNASEPFCFGTSCVTAQQAWTLKALGQQTRTHNSSDWKQLWLKNANLHEEPQIEGSTSHTFDDDWSLGDNKLFRPDDFEDTKI